MYLSKSVTVLTLSFAFTGIANAQTIQINRENKTIAISTTDEATAVADIAAITIGFEIFDKNADLVYAEGSKRSAAILKALRTANVPDANIESDEEQLGRNVGYGPPENTADHIGKEYRFAQSWEVSTSPKNAAAVIRLAVAAGANTSGEIQWRLSDRKALQANAAANALVKARAVAAQMAEGLHISMGNLIYASNQTPTTHLYFIPPPFDPNAQVGTSNETVSVTAGATPIPLKAPPLEIRPQTIREEATVYAVFAIE